MELERIADKKRVDYIIASIRKTIPDGGDVLDIGCGNGLISTAVGAYGYKVLGVDVSEKTIAHAVQHNTLENVRFKVIAANGLIPEPYRYDAVICSEVLEHLLSPADLLAIVHTSLKNTGILLVTVPNGRGPRELLVTRPVQLLQKSNGPVWRMIKRLKNVLGYKGTSVQSSADDLSHIHFFTQKDLLDLAAASGFRIENIQASNFIEQVFPFSLLARNSKYVQQLDSRAADALPLVFTSGFMSTWKKRV